MINLFKSLFHREDNSMPKKKPEPQKKPEPEIICDLCGNTIKKGELYFKHGATHTHDKCHVAVLTKGVISGK